MEKKFKFNLSKKKSIIAIIITVLMLAIIMIMALYKIKVNKVVYTGEIARSMAYEQVKDGDEDINGTDYVKFDAFFLRDLDGDGYAEKIRGSSRKIGENDTLYMELNVLTNGYLENGVITINNKNFYLQTAIPKDNEIKENVIGNNVNEIKLNNINNGTQKLLTGVIRSGDYNYASGKTSAIGNDTTKYSNKENTITLTGTHVAQDGTRTEIRKEVKFDIDWHGTTKTEIPNYLAGSRNLNQDQNIETAINEESQTFTIEHNIGIQEVNYELNLKKAVIETEIPELNGYAPTKVEVTGKNVTYTYDEETRKLVAEKEAIVNENGVITSQAYDGTYSSNVRYNRFKVKITYALEAYQKLGANTVESNLVVNAYYEGFNNTNTEFVNPYKSNIAKGTFVLTIRKLEGSVARFDIYVGKYVYQPTSRYIVSKEKTLKIYNEIADAELNDTYIVRWYGYTGESGESTGIVMKETKTGEALVSDQFTKNDNTSISMEDYTTNVGIYFSNPNGMLGDEGWIKVYDEETDELLATFTKDNWSSYTADNPYKYNTSVKHIRVETSSTNKNSGLSVYNIKKLDDEHIVENITREEFDSITHIKSTLNGYLGENHINTPIHSANYEAPFARAELVLSKSVLSTQETEKNMQITIKAQGDESINKVKWINGAFLLKFPKDILDLEINKVTSSNNSVKVMSYEQYEEDGIKYIKINMQNEEEDSFDLIIDCNVTPDPRIATQTENLELYAYNENAVEYWNKAKDIYDVNDNLNLEENVGKEVIGVNLVSPDSILTNETVTNYDEQGSIAVAPQIAVLSKSQRTADINLEIKNNYSSTISEVCILGRVPYENNKYTINGNLMGSGFTATMKSEIVLPETLGEKATVYYSENGEATKDLKDSNNGWTTNPTDFSKVKSYLIDLGEYSLVREELEQFSYTISLPENLNYNQIVYSHHAIYFTLDTPEGKFRTQTEPNKVGLMIAKQYNLELTKYQTGKEKLVSGATYSIIEEGQEEGKTRVTGVNGKLTLTNLYVDRTYIVKEIKSPSDYELNTNEIKFTTTEENGQLKVTLVSGNVKKIQAVQADSENGYQVQLEVEDEAKVGLKITKVEKENSVPIKGVRFKITGDGLISSGKSLTTDANGEVNLKGLNVGTEYILEETKCLKEFYEMSKPIKFIIENNNGKYSVNITEGNIASQITSEIDSIPTINLIIENEKIPTYNLQINKVIKGENTPLSGAKFRLYKGTEKIDDFITDENGIITINNLYQYESEKNLDQTYTLKEIFAPDGYAAIKNITFKVENIEGLLNMEVLEGNIKEQVTNGNTITITIEDTPSFKLIKKDGETGKVLPGTKFAIYNVDGGGEQLALDSKFNILGTKETIDGKDYYILTTNEKGEISANLREGLYKAIEIQTSDDKYELTDTVYYFGIGVSREGVEVITSTYSTLVSGSNNDYIKSVKSTSDGGIVAVGYFNSETLQVGDYTLTSKGNYDGMIIKYSNNMEVEWATSVGGSDDDRIESVTEISGEEIIVGGSFTGNIQVGDNSLISKGSTDGMIIKYNTDGEIKWARSIGEYDYDRIASVASISDGGIVAVGYFNKNIQVGEYKLTSNGQADGIIIKYDTDGEVEWARSVGGNSSDYINSVAELNDGSIVVGGYFESSTIQLESDTLTNKSNNSCSDGFVIKYNSKGNLKWAKSIGGTAFDYIYSIASTSDGGVIVGGCFYGTIQVEDYTLTSKGSNDGMLIKYDSEGKVNWAKSIGGTDLDYILSVASTSDGGIIVGGHFQKSVDIGLASNGYNDGMVIKYNLEGEKEWARSVGETNFDYIYSVVENLDGEIIAGGYSSEAIKNGNHITSGSTDGIIIKFGNKELSNNPVIANAISIGGTNDNFIKTIIETSDGGIIEAGTYRETNQIGDYTLTSKGDTDIMLIKHSNNMEVEWVVSIGGRYTDSISSIVETSDKGIIVGVDFMGNTQVGDYTLNGGTIIKYDSHGNLNWAKSLGKTNTSNNIYSSLATSDGGVIVGGYFYGTIQVGDYTLTGNGYKSNGMLIKYDSNGEAEWATSLIGNDNNNINSILETNDGKLIVGGEFSGTLQVGDYILRNGNYDAMIIKYSSSMEVEWATSEDISVESMIETNDGGIIVGGHFFNTIQVGDYTLTSKGGSDGILIKYNVDGEVEWTTSIGGGESDNIATVSLTSDGGIVAGGYFRTNVQVGDYTLISKGASDGMIIKYNANGDLEWIKSIGGNDVDSIMSVEELNDGSIMAKGSYSSATIEVDGKILTNIGVRNGMLLKIVNYVGVPEVQELVVKNERKEFKITTDVDEIDGVKGGSISGEDNYSYEKIKYGDTSTKEIVMIPDEGYEIIGITVNDIEHQFTANEDGSYTMPLFENMTEDKHIVVTYSLKDNKIIINKVDSETKEKLEGASFKLDQIEERTEPENVIGSLTDNGNEYFYSDTNNDITEEVLGELTNNGTYYFVKDKDGAYIPTNSKTWQINNVENATAGIQNVTANSYIPIDLTNKEGKYVVVVNANVSSEGADYGYAIVNQSITAPSYSTSTGRFVYISGTVAAKDYTSIALDGGNKYYLHLGYRKDGSVDTGDDQVVFNNIKVYGSRSKTYNFIENEGKYESTNQGKDSTVSNSYIPIDLTKCTGKYNLIVNANISSEGADYGYATVNQSTTAPSYSTSTGRIIYISGTVEAKDYTTVLQAGKMYYLHFGYNKNASISIGDDKFTVNSIRITPNDSELYHTEITSNSEGQAITQIPFGKYQVTEIETPKGYELLEEPIVIEFRENGEHEFVVENTPKAKVIVHHYLKDRDGNITEIEVADEEQLEGKSGENYTTIPHLDLDKYELEKDESGEYVIPENATGEYTGEVQEVIYYYVEKQIPLTVHHYIEGTTTKVPLIDGIEAEDEYDLGYENDEYTTNAISNDRLSNEYELAEIPINSEGIYTGNEIIVTYFYKKIERKVTIQKYAEDGKTPLSGAKFEIERTEYVTNQNGKIEVNLEAGEYNITEVEAPEGYKLSENPTTKITIDRETENLVVDIINEKIKDTSIVVHHYLIDKDGNKTTIKVAEDELFKGKEGEDYATTPKLNLEKYELQKDSNGNNILPNNATGKYNEENQEVIYYYIEKQIPLIVHHYIEGTTIKVPLSDGTEAQDENLKVYAGDNYETNAISNEELDNEYELAEIPENGSGIASGDEIVVTYYYKKIERKITIQKFAEDGKTPLSGATFTILNTDESKNGQIWTEQIKNNGTYYFTESNGKYVSNNTRRSSSVANSYIKIDTTQVESAKIVVNAEVSSQANNDYGYATITQSTSAPSYNNSNGRFIFIAGNVSAKDYEVELEGGKVYYLHFGYRKNLFTNTGSDTFTINSIKINGRDYLDYTKSIATEYITNQNGKIEVTLENGEYNITEIKAPEGYKLPENPTTKITVDRETKDFVVDIVNERIKGTVTVHHYIKGTTTHVPLSDETEAEDEIKTGSVGSTYITQAKADVLDGYVCVEEPENSSGTYIDGNIEVIYYYGPRTDLSYTVNYLEKDTNKVLYEPDTFENQTFGDTITSSEKVIKMDGYVYDSLEPETLTISADNTKNIINIYYVKNEIDLKVTKLWDDSINENNKRPEQIKVIVKNGETQVKETILTSDNAKENSSSIWEYTFEKLVKYDSEGKLITYTLEEQEVNIDDLKFYVGEVGNVIPEIDESGKTTSYTAMITNTFTVPNETIDIKVNKVWEDNNNINGKRPNSIKLIVSKVENDTQEDVVSETNQKSMVFNSKVENNTLTTIEEIEDEVSNDLFQKSNNESVENKVVEQAENTEKETNTTVEEKEDNNELQNALDQNTVLPSTTNTLTENIVLPNALMVMKETTENSIVNEIVKDEITEEAVGEDTIDETEAESNVEEVEKNDEIADKNVEDNNSVMEESEVKENASNADLSNDISDEDLLDSLDLITPEKTTIVSTHILEVSEEEFANNIWEYTLTNLPKYDENGNEIKYVVTEETMMFYEMAGGEVITETDTEGNITYTATLTNTFTVPTDTVDITVNKVWVDNAEQMKRRPESITIKLMNGDKELNQETITADNSWTVTFAGLAKYDASGNEINYTVSEESVEFYTPSYGQMTKDGENYEITITNTFTGSDETTQIPVTKVWNDNNKDRLSSVILVLTGNGQEYTQTLTEDNMASINTWEYTFTGLPKYDDNGAEIVYTLSEREVNTGDLDKYIQTVEGYTVTNTLIIKDTEISKTGPATISSLDEIINYTINYKASLDENYTDDVTVTIVDILPYEIDLDKPYNLKGGIYDSKNKTITWTEVMKAPIDITKEITLVYKDIELSDTTTTITNRATGSIELANGVKEENTSSFDTTTDFTKEITLNKVWVGDNETSRPESIEVDLVATINDAEEVKKISLPEDISKTTVKATDNWTYTWSNLPKYDIETKEEIIYNIEEVQVSGYYNSLKQEDNVFTLTNYKYGNILVTKVDSKNKETKLGGAEFKLEKLIEENGEFIVDTNFTPITKTTSTAEENKGEANFANLEYGKYRLTETKSPEGYNLLRDPIEIEVSKDNTEISLEVSNKAKTILPATGGTGVITLTAIGMLAILLAMKLNNTAKLSNKTNIRTKANNRSKINRIAKENIVKANIIKEKARRTSSRKISERRTSKAKRTKHRY